uniref:Uncharacterized protein n=1 Tax=Vespula pensylvanica TaxID=30213 RepID=A0A834PGU3_VESPE|nr:hypothetical protein H0235_001666 [Vespula pensylvanica]
MTEPEDTMALLQGRRESFEIGGFGCRGTLELRSSSWQQDKEFVRVREKERKRENRALATATAAAAAAAAATAAAAAATAATASAAAGWIDVCPAARISIS